MNATGEEMGRALEEMQSVSLEAHILQGMGKKGRPLYPACPGFFGTAR
jgi:hypothetical protein